MMRLCADSAVTAAGASVAVGVCSALQAAMNSGLGSSAGNAMYGAFTCYVVGCLGLAVCFLLLRLLHACGFRFASSLFEARGVAADLLSHGSDRSLLEVVDESSPLSPKGGFAASVSSYSSASVSGASVETALHRSSAAVHGQAHGHGEGNGHDHDGHDGLHGVERGRPHSTRVGWLPLVRKPAKSPHVRSHQTDDASAHSQHDSSTSTRPKPHELLGGVCGALFLITAVHAAPVLGTATLFALVVVGQLGASVVGDHFGLGKQRHPITTAKLLCLAVAVCGVAVSGVSSTLDGEVTGGDVAATRQTRLTGRSASTANGATVLGSRPGLWLNHDNDTTSSHGTAGPSLTTGLSLVGAAEDDDGTATDDDGGGSGGGGDDPGSNNKPPQSQTVLEVGLGVAACLAGAFQPAQALLNWRLSRKLPHWSWAVLISFTVSLCVAGIASLAVLGLSASGEAGGATKVLNDIWARLTSTAQTPAYMWLGAPLQLLVLSGGIILPPRISTSVYYTCYITGELVCSLILDSQGALGLTTRAVTPGRVAGLVLVSIGAAALQGHALVQAVLTGMHARCCGSSTQCFSCCSGGRGQSGHTRVGHADEVDVAAADDGG